MKEICNRYEAEWLLIRIMDPTAQMGDAPGQLLARGADRDAIFRAERKARKLEPRALLTVLKGGTKFGDGEALRRALARIAAEEEFVSVHSW